MSKLIINAALTGMVPQRTDSPHVPLSPDEIIADARRCVSAGATILHVHAREPDGAPSCRTEIYAEIIHGIREACPGVMISGSCSGRLHGEFAQRSGVLDLLPDFGSLTLGSLNFPTQASVNSPQMIQQLATRMNQLGVTPEWELFDLGMIDTAKHLMKKNILQPPYYANILLGSLGTLGATPDNLCAMVRALPEGVTWAAAGIGRFQWPVNQWAVTMGGHVRVGLEDALYYDWETRRHATNAGLIERVVRLALAAGREIASVDEARKIVGLERRQPACRAA